MGTITITSVGDVDHGTKEEIFNVSDENLNRFIEWGKVAYPTIDPDTGVSSPAGPNAAHHRMWKATVDGMKNNVERHEHVTALQAVPPPEPIDISP